MGIKGKINLGSDIWKDQLIKMQRQQSHFMLFALTTIIIVRSSYVYFYASSMPFWDQWDTEGDQLLRPWVEGNFEISNLWQPHNEHRIFPTRLLVLTSYIFLKQWNNLTLAYFNVLLIALISACLMSVALGTTSLCKNTFWFLLAIIFQFSFPFAYENILVSFQSQFYFLILFTLGSLFLALTYLDKAWAQLAIAMICALCILTTASGLLTPIVLIIIVTLQFEEGKHIKYQTRYLLIVLSLETLIGVVLIPHIQANSLYKADNLEEWLYASARILSWPTGLYNCAFIFLWLPAAVAFPLLKRKKTISKTDLLMVGCYTWSLGQGLAIAYGRGHEFTSIASRYTELLSLGLISNAWFSLRLIGRDLNNRLPKYNLIAITFLLAFSIGHLKRVRSDIGQMKRHHNYSRLQTYNVQKYIETNNASYLNQPGFRIPYPDSSRLKKLLDSPTIKNLLPRHIKGSS